MADDLESRGTVMLPNGELVSAPDYSIVPAETRADDYREILGDRLLPSDRRSFQFAKRRIVGFVPEEQGRGAGLKRSYYDD